jgi:hypothetical protein
MIRLLAACFCALIFCGSAEARQRHKSPAHDPACNVINSAEHAQSFRLHPLESIRVGACDTRGGDQ